MKSTPWITAKRSHWLVFLLAVGIRLWSVAESSNVDPAFAFPIVDEQTNVDQARGFLSDGPGHGAPYWKPPGYPALLALIALPWGEIGTAGHGVPTSYAWAVKILQCILDACSALMIVKIAAATAGRVAALLSGLLYAIAAMPVYFCSQFLDTTLFTFLMLLSVFLACSAFADRRVTPWIPVGMAIGLACITRATGLPVAAGLVLVAGLQQGTWKLRGMRAGVVAAACAMAMLPIFAVNLKLGHDAVLISSNGGINFYIGNRSGDGIGSDGLTSVATGPRWDQLLEKSDDLRLPSERSRRYYSLALQEIIAEPGRWLQKMGRKAAALVSARDVPNNKNLIEETRRNRVHWLLSWLPGASGPLMALVLAGLLIGKRGLRDDDLPLRVSLLLLALTTWSFFVAGRFRVAILALGCVVAGRGLVTLGLRWRALLVMVPLLIGVHAIPVPARSLMDGYCIDPVAIGYVHEQRGEPDLAAQWYQRSLDQDPGDVRALHNLAHLAQEAGNLPLALERFRSATTIAPNHAPSWNSLGALLVALDPPQALRCFREAVERDPEYVGAWINLGQFLESSGELHKAQDAYQRARRLEPARAMPPFLEARIQNKLRSPRNAQRLLRMVNPQLLEPGTRELYEQLSEEVRKQLEDVPAPPDAIPQQPESQDDADPDRPEERGVVG
jgi:tetratricopeptide (TPR) repeat protein